MDDTRTKKILITTDMYWPEIGGVTESIRSIIAEFSQKYSFTVLSAPITPSGKTEPADPDGNRIETVTPDWRVLIVKPFFALSGSLFIKKWFSKKWFDTLYLMYRFLFYKKVSDQIRNFDLVHNFSTGHLMILTTDICRELNLPIIQAPPIHFDRWGDTPRQLKSCLNTDIMICPTRFFLEQMESRTGKLFPKAVINPPLPARPSESSGKPHKLSGIDRFILFIARIDPVKGLQTLLDAYEIALIEIPLVIVGPENPDYPIDIPSKHLRLQFVEGEEKKWLFENCTFLCVPSVEESFGMIYTEAMACGKAVIACDIKPVNEIVIHNQTGLLVPPHDANKLAEALAALQSDAERCTRMGENGLSRYQKHYSREQVISTTDKIYRDLIEVKDSTSP